MRVAIVIPTHDRATWVVQAVESALAQTHPASVVVVDDGSTDGTAEILRTRFGGRIRVVIQENRERGAARNRGAGEADRAELLCFLDADDLLLPEHVAHLVRGAEAHPEVPLLAARGRAVDVALRPLGRVGAEAPGRVDFEAFIRGGIALPTSLCAIRAPAFHELGGYEEERAVAGSEDWLLHARLLAHGGGVQLAERSVLLRKHPANTMADPARMLASMTAAHALLFGRHRAELPGAELPAADLARLERKAKAVLLVHAATAFYGEGAMRRARALLRAALAEDPCSVLDDPRIPWTFLRSLLGGWTTRYLRAGKARLLGR